MRTKEVVLTNMVMIRDPQTGSILVQERTKDWQGITFPGGHVEAGESFYAAAAREAWEETGLTVKGLRLCGIAHWCEAESDRRYLVFLYKTESFVGALTEDDGEGRLLWMTEEELRASRLSANMEEMLEVLLREDASEAFGAWAEDFSAPMEVF